MTEQVSFDTPKYFTVIRLEETTEDTYCYIAYHPELPSCISQGDTPKEAEENLVEATELALNHLASSNLPVPKPWSWQTFGSSIQMVSTPVGAEDNDHAIGYSGTFDSISKEEPLPSGQILALTAT